MVNVIFGFVHERTHTNRHDKEARHIFKSDIELSELCWNMTFSVGISVHMYASDCVFLLLLLSLLLFQVQLDIREQVGKSTLLDYKAPSKTGRPTDIVSC